MVVDPAQDYKLKEWYSEMNSGASAYAEGKVEFTKSAFPERPGGKPEVVMGGGVEKYSESACGNSNGQCLKDEEARKIMAEYGGLLKTGSMHEGVAEKLFTDDIELVSDSMSWIRTGQVSGMRDAHRFRLHGGFILKYFPAPSDKYPNSKRVHQQGTFSSAEPWRYQSAEASMDLRYHHTV